MAPAGTSPKSLPVTSWPTPSVMPLMTEGLDVGGVAVPPPLPALVMPLSVPAGCSGSVMVYVPGGNSVKA